MPFIILNRSCPMELISPASTNTSFAPSVQFAPRLRNAPSGGLDRTGLTENEMGLEMCIWAN